MRNNVSVLLILLAISIGNAWADERSPGLSDEDKAIIRAATRNYRLPEGIENKLFKRGNQTIEVWGDVRYFFGHGENSRDDQPDNSAENPGFRESFRGFLLEQLYWVATRPNDNVDPDFKNVGIFPTEREQDLWYILKQLFDTEHYRGYSIPDDVAIEILEFFHNLPRRQAVLASELEAVEKVFRFLSTDNRVNALYMAIETLSEINPPLGVTAIVEFIENGENSTFSSSPLRSGFEIFRLAQETARDHPQFIPLAHSILDLLEKKGVGITGKEHLKIGRQ